LDNKEIIPQKEITIREIIREIKKKSLEARKKTKAKVFSIISVFFKRKMRKIGRNSEKKNDLMHSRIGNLLTIIK
jgi:hypothetical protein